MKPFGFNDLFSELVETILHSARLSFGVNGSFMGYLACKKRVWQGDPLSPLLFFIFVDILSRRISFLANHGLLLHMASPHGFQSPTHVFIIGGIMVFSNGSTKTLKNLMFLIKQYG
uniref:Reverse transcriptase domain-containing protein n=1 Tax=Cajanus cajan TaxID=3821 RepID=A0A151S768_CAJCA|nr:hypothetical protein KK1_027602 [Cajanus cajan]